MDVVSVEEFLGLFERHPPLAVSALLVVLVGWVIRNNVLEIVSKRKSRRREVVFDSYEKILAVRGVSDEERASVIAELLAVAEGFPSRVSLAESEGPVAPPRSLSPVAAGIVRVADGVIKLWLAAVALFVAASFIFTTGFGFWCMATWWGEPDLFVFGFVLGPGMLLLGVTIAPHVVRDLAKGHPRVLLRVEWFEQKTEGVVDFGKAVVLFGGGLYFLLVAGFVALEFDALLGWSLAAGIASFGLASTVKMWTMFFGPLGTVTQGVGGAQLGEGLADRAPFGESA